MEKEKRPDEGIFISSVMGGLVAALSAALFMLISAMVLLLFEDPAPFAFVGRIILFVSAFLGGLLSTLLSGKKALLSGLLAGAVYSAAVLAAMLITGAGSSSFLVFPAVLAVSVIGAVIGNIRGSGSNIPSFNDKKYVIKPKGYQK